jgi:D-tagatose-1,6-bisphosphate aldolase subunit GatZ/KbaZ
MTPRPLNQLITRLIHLREQGHEITLLAVCPNSEAVLEAAVMVAASNQMPMLFAATLNQVDRDRGYTGWTPASFVKQIDIFADKYGSKVANTKPLSLYPCLDHGGPWLKDKHTLERLSLSETMDEVKQTLTACLKAGYALLHIDPTIDRSLPDHQPVPIPLVIARTVELIEHAERERLRIGLPPISYEVGTEEVHGGLVDMDNFRQFIQGLQNGLAERGLSSAWPCFVVGKVGTDLHTTFFDLASAQRLYEILKPMGSLVKGHYTDWVANPEAYPQSGMGGANVGPEFTSVEYQALAELAAREKDVLLTQLETEPSHLLEALEEAVYVSDRWWKWLLPGEESVPFNDLFPERRSWLVQTGCRYIWTDEKVQQARQKLYANLAPVFADPHQFVLERIAGAMERYVKAFNLSNSLSLFDG